MLHCIKVRNAKQSASKRRGLGCFIVSKYKISKQVASSALGTAVSSPPDQSSQFGLGRLGPTPSAAHAARLFAAPDHNSLVGLGVCSKLLSHNTSDCFARMGKLTVSMCEAENAIWPNFMLKI